MHPGRYERLVEGICARGLDALALVPGPNLFYLTGLSFHLSERPVVALLPSVGRAAVILPRLEATKLEGHDGLAPFAYADEEGHEEAFRRACDALDLQDSVIGAEGFRMRRRAIALSRLARPSSSTVEPAAEAMRRTSPARLSLGGWMVKCLTSTTWCAPPIALVGERSIPGCQLRRPAAANTSSIVPATAWD